MIYCFDILEVGFLISCLCGLGVVFNPPPCGHPLKWGTPAGRLAGVRTACLCSIAPTGLTYRTQTLRRFAPSPFEKGGQGDSRPASRNYL